MCVCVLLNKYKYINININVNINILYVSILPMYLYNFIHLNIIQRAITAIVPLMLWRISLGPSGVGILWHFLLREHLQAEAIDNGASWSSEEPRLSVHLSKKDWFKGNHGKPLICHGKIDGFRLRFSQENQSIQSLIASCRHVMEGFAVDNSQSLAIATEVGQPTISNTIFLQQKIHLIPNNSVGEIHSFNDISKKWRAVAQATRAARW